MTFDFGMVAGVAGATWPRTKGEADRTSDASARARGTKRGRVLEVFMVPSGERHRVGVRRRGHRVRGGPRCGQKFEIQACQSNGPFGFTVWHESSHPDRALSGSRSR